MTAIEILQAFASDGELADEVLDYLNQGMWDEWDTSLGGALEHGLGPAEFAIAARTAALIAGFRKGIT